MVENVVVDSESNGASNVSDGKRDGGDGSDEFCWADNLRNNRAWNDDGTHKDRCEGNDGVHERCDVVEHGVRHGADESSHSTSEDDHENLGASLSNTNENESEESAKDDTKSDWECSNTDTNGVVSVHVVNLGWPEEKNDEEVSTREEGDEQDHNHRLLVLLEHSLGAHGELGELHLPDEEGDDADATNDEWCKNVGTSPGVLGSSPLETHHEAGDSEDAENTTNVINFLEDILGGSLRLVTGSWVLVDEHDEEKTDEVPDTDKDTNVSPVGCLGDELSPERRWAEWQDGEDNGSDVGATLADRHKFGSSREGDQFVQTGTETRNNLTS